MKNDCLNCGGKGYRVYRHKDAKPLTDLDPDRKDRFERVPCKRCGGKGVLTIVEKTAEEIERSDRV